MTTNLSHIYQTYDRVRLASIEARIALATEAAQAARESLIKWQAILADLNNEAATLRRTMNNK
jgi:flagellin-specific chaperone FliS